MIERVIFLDFDGVMNSFPYLVREENFTKLDPEPAKHLNEIINQTDAKIVISSAWRLCHTLEQLTIILAEIGIAAPILGVTPRANGHRGTEIFQWLEDCDFDGNILVIDDDSDIEPFGEVHVHTSFQEGLLEQHIEKAIGILNGNQSVQSVWRRKQGQTV